MLLQRKHSFFIMCIVCMHTTPTLHCSVIVNASVYAQCTHHNTTLHHRAADTSVIVNAHCTITLHCGQHQCHCQCQPAPDSARTFPLYSAAAFLQNSIPTRNFLQQTDSACTLSLPSSFNCLQRIRKSGHPSPF